MFGLAFGIAKVGGYTLLILLLLGLAVLILFMAKSVWDWAKKEGDESETKESMTTRAKRKWKGIKKNVKDRIPDFIKNELGERGEEIKEEDDEKDDEEQPEGRDTDG